MPLRPHARTLAWIRILREIAPKQVRRRGGRLPRQIQPDGVRLEYARALQRIVGDKTSIGTSEAARIMEAAERYGKMTGRFQWVQLDKQVRSALGVSLGAIERPIHDPIPRFVDENIRLIRGALERRRSMDATLPEDLVQEIGFDIQRIASDQIGKLFGEYNEERQSGIGIDGYTWKCYDPCEICGQFCDSEFKWDDPPPQGHPGDVHPNCRCEAEPLFEAIQEDLRVAASP